MSARPWEGLQSIISIAREIVRVALHHERVSIKVGANKETESGR